MRPRTPLTAHSEACKANRPILDGMVSFIKSVTFDCHEPLLVATFWAEALGSNVDEDSTPNRA